MTQTTDTSTAPRHAADSAGGSPWNPATFAKALGAGALAGLGVLYIALNDDIVTAQEWVGVAQGALSAAAVVYGLPNKGVK